MHEWVRHLFSCALLLSAIVVEAFAVLGQYRLRYSLNRAHPAGMGDTLAILLLLLAGMVEYGLSISSLKLLLVLILLWLTSPLSTHLIGQMVEITDATLATEAREWKS